MAMGENDQIQGNGLSGSGAGADNVNSTLQGIVRNLGQLVTNTSTVDITNALAALATATLGANIGSTNNPGVSIATVGTASLLVVAANSTRLTIAFHSPNPAAANMWVVPSNATAVAGRGVLVLPGGTVMFPSTCGWNAIATSGSANMLSVMEWT